jgi:hypothetical protein
MPQHNAALALGQRLLRKCGQDIRIGMAGDRRSCLEALDYDF